jgi:hypothetical protein
MLRWPAQMAITGTDTNCRRKIRQIKFPFAILRNANRRQPGEKYASIKKRPARWNQVKADEDGNREVAHWFLPHPPDGVRALDRQAAARIRS